MRRVARGVWRACVAAAAACHLAGAFQAAGR
jgi:hypothetical protein